MFVAEITAANRANVCTFAVMGKTEIDQIVSHFFFYYMYLFNVII